MRRRVKKSEQRRQGGSVGEARPPARYKSTSVADRVYELSSALEGLRSRSADNAELLRSVAQGEPELEEAFIPLLAALEAGLAECNKANLEAVFGRPPSPKRGLESLPAARVAGCGGGGGGGGGTAAAVERLSTAITSLGRDVAAAGMLAKQGANLRTIARWTLQAMRPPSLPPASSTAPCERHSVHAPPGGSVPAIVDNDNDDAYNRRNPGGESRDIPAESRNNPRQGLPRPEECAGPDYRDWVIRAFRPRAIDGGGGSSTTTTSSIDPGPYQAQLPMVAVQALRLPIPQTAPARVSGEALPSPRDGPRAPAEAGGGGSGRGWLNPFSWLASYGGRAAGSEVSVTAPVPAPLSPVPPRVILRVIYAGRTPDMARLARAGGRKRNRQGVVGAAAEDSAAAPSAADETPLPGGAFHDGTRLPVNEHERGTPVAAAAAVELVRSEVRFEEPAGTAEDSFSQGGEVAASATPGVGIGDVSRPAVKLQVVIQLRTSTPLVVSRLLHAGGHPLSPPPRRRVSARLAFSSPIPQARSNSSLCTGRTESLAADGQERGGDRNSDVGRGRASGVGGLGAELDGCGVDGVGDVSEAGAGRSRSGGGGGGGRARRSGLISSGGVTGAGSRKRGEGDDIFPSGWSETPEELFLPGGPDEDGCELKAGVDHLLGMNILLPSEPLPNINPSRARRRRGSQAQTPLGAGNPGDRPPAGSRDPRSRAFDGVGAPRAHQEPRDADRLGRGKSVEPCVPRSSSKKRGRYEEDEDYGAGGEESGSAVKRFRDGNSYRRRRHLAVDGRGCGPAASREVERGEGGTTAAELGQGSRNSDYGHADASATRSTVSGASPSSLPTFRDGSRGTEGNGDGRELQKKSSWGWGWGMFRLWNRGYHEEAAPAPPVIIASSPAPWRLRRLQQEEQRRQQQPSGAASGEGGRSVRAVGEGSGRGSPPERGTTPSGGPRGDGSVTPPGRAPRENGFAEARERSPLLVTVVLAPPPSSSL